MNNEALDQQQKLLIEKYFDDQVSEAEIAELEALLSLSLEAREYFFDLGQLQADLNHLARSERGVKQILEKIEQSEPTLKEPNRKPDSSSNSRFATTRWIVALACGLGFVLAYGVWAILSQPVGQVAWLANAQDCRWNGLSPTREIMVSGTELNLESGFAEIHFASGAKVVLEGPARLQLKSSKRAHLEFGRLTASIPDELDGFEITSPQGKIVDLGTEFGVAVSSERQTEVVVFDGLVHASSTDQVNVTEISTNQSARIFGGDVNMLDEPSVNLASHFTRDIEASPVLQAVEMKWEFSTGSKSGLLDKNGKAIGLNTRLPGTGEQIGEQDPNLELDTENGLLKLKTTRNDINRQQQLGNGEYIGVLLTDLGFDGSGDFRIEAKISNIPAMEGFGQFGLFAGTRSDKNIRGGIIKWGERGEPDENTAFLVNNDGGDDRDGFNIGLQSAGDDLRLVLSRTKGRYLLTVENLTMEASSTLEIKQPKFLDGESDLVVGLFGANPFNDARKIVSVDEFSVTIWKPVDNVGFNSKSNLD